MQIHIETELQEVCGNGYRPFAQLIGGYNIRVLRLSYRLRRLNKKYLYVGHQQKCITGNAQIVCSWWLLILNRQTQIGRTLPKFTKRIGLKFFIK